MTSSASFSCSSNYLSLPILTYNEVLNYQAVVTEKINSSLAGPGHLWEAKTEIYDIVLRAMGIVSVG
jgi:hypothetical protein